MMYLGIYGIQDIRRENYPIFIHDHSFSFFKEGFITNYCHLERITRRKFDNRLHNLIENLLLKRISFSKNIEFIFTDSEVGRSFISYNGKIRFEVCPSDKLINHPEEGYLYLFGKKQKGYIVSHELAHIFSSVPFYGIFKDDSLLIHYDGGASLSNFSAWYYKNGKLNLLEYHYDLKPITSLFNANALVFKLMNANVKNQNSVPGKFMAYASYGKYNEDIENWLRDNNFFQNIWQNENLFLETLKKKWNVNINNFDLNNEFLKNIAATIHEVFVRESYKKIESLQKKTNAKYLYLTGGCALNIKLNERILKSKIFTDIFIPPCPGDSGLSIGACSCLLFFKGEKVEIHSPYLNNWGIENYHLSENIDYDKIANLLINGKVIGICNGYGEVGPRALGNRSIIALANSKNLAKKVNEVIKKREWFRPLAPVMLEKNAQFFTDNQNLHHLSRYMLMNFEILNNRQDEIKGCVHVDNSARIQVIFNQQENPFMYNLLSLLDEKYGIKALINTSFNCSGEPIVHTIDDAINSGKKIGLDALILNGKIELL